MDAIRRAIELGESAELIRQEDEFRALHSRPEFIAGRYSGVTNRST